MGSAKKKANEWGMQRVSGEELREYLKLPIDRELTRPGEVEVRVLPDGRVLWKSVRGRSAATWPSREEAIEMNSVPLWRAPRGPSRSHPHAPPADRRASCVMSRPCGSLGPAPPSRTKRSTEMLGREPRGRRQRPQADPFGRAAGGRSRDAARRLRRRGAAQGQRWPVDQGAAHVHGAGGRLRPRRDGGLLGRQRRAGPDGGGRRRESRGRGEGAASFGVGRGPGHQRGASRRLPGERRDPAEADPNRRGPKKAARIP